MHVAKVARRLGVIKHGTAQKLLLLLSLTIISYALVELVEGQGASAEGLSNSRAGLSLPHCPRADGPARGLAYVSHAVALRARDAGRAGDGVLVCEPRDGGVSVRAEGCMQYGTEPTEPSLPLVPQR